MKNVGDHLREGAGHCIAIRKEAQGKESEKCKSDGKMVSHLLMK